MDNKDQLTGKIKQAAGDLTDDQDLKNKGKTEEKAGDAKEFVEKVAGKVGDMIDGAKKRLTKD
ncbi:MAG: CsbD family protein [Actinomycetota bacterium]|nr:CsbD family protein [Actinomycetota bacterium]